MGDIHSSGEGAGAEAQREASSSGRAGDWLIPIDVFAAPPSDALLSLRSLLHPGKGYEENLSSLRPTPSPRKTRDHRQRTASPPETTVEVPLTQRERMMLRVVVDYCNGKTQVEIASKHGLHMQTVRRLLRQAGVVVRDHLAALSAADLQTIRIAHARGVSLRELGRRYGVAHTTILRSL